MMKRVPKHATKQLLGPIWCYFEGQLSDRCWYFHKPSLQPLICFRRSYYGGIAKIVIETFLSLGVSCFAVAWNRLSESPQKSLMMLNSIWFCSGRLAGTHADARKVPPMLLKMMMFELSWRYSWNFYDPSLVVILVESVVYTFRNCKEILVSYGISNFSFSPNLHCTAR